MTINFSNRALEMQKRRSFIELCNNDCGAWVYQDLDDGKIKNAEISKKDSVHYKTCSTLKHAWKIAASHNWFPSYSFLEQAEAFIESAKKMYPIAIDLEKSLKNRADYNTQAKAEWDEEKKKKTQEKREKRYRNGV